MLESAMEAMLLAELARQTQLKSHYTTKESPGTEYEVDSVEDGEEKEDWYDSKAYWDYKNGKNPKHELKEVNRRTKYGGRMYKAKR